MEEVPGKDRSDRAKRKQASNPCFEPLCRVGVCNLIGEQQQTSRPEHGFVPRGHVDGVGTPNRTDKWEPKENDYPRSVFLEVQPILACGPQAAADPNRDQRTPKHEIKA